MANSLDRLPSGNFDNYELIRGQVFCITYSHDEVVQKLKIPSSEIAKAVAANKLRYMLDSNGKFLFYLHDLIAFQKNRNIEVIPNLPTKPSKQEEEDSMVKLLINVQKIVEPVFTEKDQ